MKPPHDMVVRCFGAFVAVVLLAAPMASAAIYYWDANGASTTAVAATGTWGTDNFWSTDSTGTTATSAQTIDNTSDLFFSAASNSTGGTVTINGTVLAHSIAFDDATGGIILAGGTAINLGSATAGSGIFFTNVTGSANTISTGIILNSAATAISLTNSGTALQTIGAITGAASSGTQTINLSAINTGGITLNGVIADGGSGGKVALTVNSGGTGIITLTSANTYTGDTTLGTGNLNLDFSAAGAPSTNIINNVSNTSALKFTGGGTLTLIGASGATNSQQWASTSLDGGAVITLTQNGATTLSTSLGAITRTTGGTLNFSTIPLTSGVIATTSNAINTPLGTWATVGSGTTLSYATVNGSGQIVAMTTSNGSTAAAAANNLTDTTGLVNYDLALATGTVQASMSANTIRFTGAANTTAPGATLFQVNGLINSGSGLWTIGTNNITIGANNELVIATGTNGITITSAIGGAAGAGLTYGGTGALTLSKANTYTGTTTVNSGTLNLGIAAALNSASSLVINGGTFGEGTFADTVAAVTLRSGSITGTTGILTSTAAFNLQSGTISAPLGGTAGLNKTTPGTLTFSSTTAGTLTGNININAGTLIMGGTAVVSFAGANTINLGESGTAADARLAVQNTQATYANPIVLTTGSTGNLSIGNLGTTAIAFNNAATVTGTNNLTISNTNTGGLTFTNVNNTGAVINSGAGTGATTITTLGSNVTSLTEAGVSALTVTNAVALTASLNSFTNSGSGLFTLSGQITGAQNLTLSANSTGNITLTGGSNNGGSILNNGSGANTVTIGAIGALVTGGVTQNSSTGTSTLLLNGAGLYTGGTTITAGILKVGNATALGANTSAVSVASGAVLDVNGIAMTGTNALTLNGSGIGGTGALINSSNTNATYAGGITLGSASTIGITSMGSLKVSDGTNSVINLNGFLLTFKGVGANFPSTQNIQVPIGNGITGAGGITVDNVYLDLRQGGGQSTNTYSGTTTVQNNGGILHNGNLSTNSNIVLNGGVIDTYNNGSFSRTLGTGVSQIQITGGASGFGTNGSGTVTLGAATWGSATFNPTSLLLGTPGSSAGTTTYASAIDLNGATRTIATNSTVNAGAISGNLTNSTGTAGLNKSGAGTLTLSGSNTFNGGLFIMQGTLNATTSANALGGTGTGAVTLGDSAVGFGATLNIDGRTFANPITLGSGATGTLTLGNSATSAIYSGGITGSNSFFINNSGAAASTLTFQTGSLTNTGLITNGGSSTGTTTISSNITSANTGGLTQSTIATLLLSGTNTYSGPTKINSGTLQFAKTVSLYNNTASNWTTTNLSVTAGATVALNVGGSGEFSTTDLSTFLDGSHMGLSTSTTGFNTGSKLALDTTNAGGSFTPTTLIADPGTSSLLGLTKLGTGTLILNLANTYSGGTTISVGTLQIGSGGTAGSISNTSGVLNNAALVFNRTDTYGGNFTQLITGTGTLAVSAGTLTLTAANNYTGTTTLTGGNLTLGNALAIQNSALVTTGAGTLTLGNGITTPTFGGLSGGSGNLATIITNYSSITDLILNPSGSVSYGGVIGANGAMTLTKTGAGTQTLTGANTYTGLTTINRGTLTIGSGGSLNGTTGTALTFSNTGTFNVAEGTSSNQGMGVLTMSAGDGTVQSTFSATSATLTFGSLAARATGATVNFVTSAGTASTLNTAGTNKILFTSTASNVPLSTTSNNSGIFFNGSNYARYDATAGVGLRAIVYGTDTNANASLSGNANTTLGTITSSTDTQFVGASRATTTSGTVSGTNTNTLVVTDGTLFGVGNILTGTNIAANSYVASIAGNTLTLANVNGGNAIGGTAVGAGTTLTPYNAIGAQTTGSVNTLNLSGTGAALVLAAGQTLSVNGILRSGQGAGVASLIAGGTGIKAVASGGEIVVRTDLSTDNLFIGSPILDNSTSSLTKTGLGTLTLSGSSTYAGGTVINAGTLVISSDANVGGGSVTINAGGTLTTGKQAYAINMTLNGGTLNIASDGSSGPMSGILTLAANSTISSSNTNSGVARISGNLVGIGGFTKTGSGGLQLNGSNNTYSGPTVVNGAASSGITVKSSLYGNDTTKWTAANITVNSGNTLLLNIGGVGEFTLAQADIMFSQLSSNINNNGLLAGSTIGVDTRNAAAGTYIYSALITDSTGNGGGAINFKHTGAATTALKMTAANTFSGQTIVDNGSTLIVSSLNSVFTNTALGTVHSASSSLGAPTTVANGTIHLGSGGSASNIGNTFQGGNLTYIGAGETTDRVLSLNGGGGETYKIDQSGTGLLKFVSNFAMGDTRGSKTINLLGSTTGSGEIAGIIPTTSTNSMLVTKTGTGTWTLSGSNTYLGGTTISGGTLIFSGASSMPTIGTLAVGAAGNLSLADGTARNSTVSAVTLASGATLTFDWTGASIGDQLTSAAAITPGATANIGIAINNTVGTPSGNVTLLTGGSASTLSTTARFFTANNTNFTASLTATPTTLSIGSYATATALTNAYWKGGVVTNATGAMAFSLGTLSNWASNAAGATANGVVPGGTGVNVIFGATGGTQQASVTTGADMNLGSITFNDTVAVTVAGSNAITLYNTSTAAATTTAALATITNAGSNTNSAISVTSFANATNTISANLVLGSNQTWNVASTKTLAVSGVVSGAYSLTKADAGAVTLSGVNTYTGGTTLAGGTINYNTTGALGTGALTFSGSGLGVLLANGVTLSNDITIGTNTGVSGAGMIKVGNGNTATLAGTITISNSANLGGHFGGDTPAGTGTLNITGAVNSSVTVSVRSATVVFSGGGSYTDLGVGQATVKLGANNGLSTSATVNVATVGTQPGNLDLAGFNQQLVGITKGGGTVATIGNSSTTSNSTLTTTGTSSYAGVIQDTLGSGNKKVALTVNGGSLTLTNTNTYTGATNVSSGILSIGSVGTPTGSINNTSAINVAAGGTLRYNSSTALTVAPTLAGNGTSNRAVLGGTGTINAAVTLDNLGDVLSPGNSPGVQNYAVGQTWSSFSYDWELNDWTAAVAGTNIDQITITGTLDLSAVTANQYILNILSLMNNNSSGLVGSGGGNLFSETNNSWTILTATTITGFNASEWSINAAGFTDNETGTWSISQSGNSLLLNYAAVPEPSVALLGGLSLLGLVLRRRRR